MQRKVGEELKQKPRVRHRRKTPLRRHSAGAAPTSVVFPAKNRHFALSKLEKTALSTLDCACNSISIRDTSEKARFPLGKQVNF
jgi:hypothetical protein